MSFNFLTVTVLISKQDLYMLPIIFTGNLNYTISKSLCDQLMDKGLNGNLGG